MAAKRGLDQTSNKILKKPKFDHGISLEDLKASVNLSSKSKTVVLGNKTFDVSNLGKLADVFLQELPAFEFEKGDGEDESTLYSINISEPFSENQMRLLVDRLELTGAACVFYGDKFVRMQGFVLWSIVLKLRGSYPHLKISKEDLEPTPLEKRILNGKQEATTFEDLKSLLRQRRKHWVVQGILKTQRVCKLLNCYPNFLFFDGFYTALMLNWQKKNSTEDAVFFQVLLMIELANSHLLKRRPIVEIEDPILKVLSELQKVLKAPSVTFDTLMFCLSFATRLNIASLRKGQKEGVALDHVHAILKRIVQTPNRDQSRLTTLMEKYMKKYKENLPPCAISHFAFTGLKKLDIETEFQTENWIVPLKVFLSLKKPQVKSLLCVTASYVKTMIETLNVEIVDLPTEVEILFKYH